MLEVMQCLILNCTLHSESIKKENAKRWIIFENAHIFKLSLRRNWVPPARSVSPPTDPKGGKEQYSFADEGGGGPNSDDWKESLALCIL